MSAPPFGIDSVTVDDELVPVHEEVVRSTPFGALLRFAVFQSEGTTGPLATVATLATLCLVLPSFTTSTPGPVFSGTQLAFAAVAVGLIDLDARTAVAPWHRCPHQT